MDGDIFSSEPIDSNELEFESWRLGIYQVLRKIGSGGMGSVYLALRADEDFKKHVAIKVIRKGMDSEDIISRFRRERQILSSLDHPNIARFLDGGTTQEGLPYFVMEHVQGVPLTEYCDHHQLNINQCLELFRSVCSAVQYAHQNLVVHRDLKPGNILVTADGTVKLLDFGIAKLLNPDLFDVEAPPTATNIRVMTPEYASPEQARGGPITTASDVYSMGVVLYELLTGLRPYQFTNRNQVEICRVICEQEPTKPSTAVSEKGNADMEKFSALRGATSQKLRKQLQGDLDNIVLSALRKEPQLRYASAQAISDDVGRYLEGYTVSARQPTWRYRAGKYLTRHKIGVAASAMVVFLLLASSVLLLYQNARIRRERDTAEREKQKAEQVTKLLVNVFEVNDPDEAKGETITAREILDRGAQRVTKELQDKPDVQAQLLRTIGTIYTRLGLYDRAQPLLEKALQIRKTYYGNENVAVAESLNDLGYFFMLKGQNKKAEKLLREALAMRRKLLGREHLDVAESLMWLAAVLVPQRNRSLDNFQEEEKLIREALAIRRKLFGKEHLSVAGSLTSLARLLQIRGDLSEAERAYRESIAMYRKLGNQDLDMASALYDFSFLLQLKGELEEAEKVCRESIAIRRKLLGSEHPDLARSLGQLASFLQQKGELDEAEKLNREVVRIDRKLLPKEHPVTAFALYNLGLVLCDKGELDEAKKLLREAVTINRIDFMLEGLASVLQGKGELDESEKLYREAIALRRKSGRDKHPGMAANLAGMAEVLFTEGRTQEAVSVLTEALAIPKESLPENSRFRARAESAMGACLASQGKYAEAEPLLVHAYKILSVQEKVRKTTAMTRQRIIDLYTSWGNPKKHKSSS
jgi:serine/threonine protein kinase/Tfp pilus assembly protein PilF